MNSRILVVWLACFALFTTSCRRHEAVRYLIISEAVHFELQPGNGTLNLPVFAGTLGVEKIVRDVSQAEFYYQKLSTIHGPRSFRFLADSTVELLLEKAGPLHSPQLVYGFDDDSSRVDLSLVGFANNTAHYAFRVTAKRSGQVRDHSVDVPMGESASIGILYDPRQKSGHIVAIAIQSLAIDKDLTPARLAAFLREKNTPRGVTTPSGFLAGDQRWMNDIFGKQAIRLATDSDSANKEQRQPFDVAPAPIGGMSAFAEQFTYPQSAKRDSLEGRVVVEVKIDEQGIIRDCRVVRSVRYDLDSAAVTAVRDVRFTPAIYRGKPVATTVMIPIAFKLQ